MHGSKNSTEPAGPLRRRQTVLGDPGVDTGVLVGASGVGRQPPIRCRRLLRLDRRLDQAELAACPG